jgi:hypothetical protein
MQIQDPKKEFGSGIKDGNKSDPESGINIPDPQQGREVTSAYWHYIRYLDKNREN